MLMQRLQNFIFYPLPIISHEIVILCFYLFICLFIFFHNFSLLTTIITIIIYWMCKETLIYRICTFIAYIFSFENVSTRDVKGLLANQFIGLESNWKIILLTTKYTYLHKRNHIYQLMIRGIQFIDLEKIQLKMKFWK